VSVVIPVFDGETYLQRAIESVLAQDVDLELIVVDDHSTDASAEIARSYPSVRYMRTEGRSGQGYPPVNLGIAIARGEYLAVLHHDDTWRPSKLARHLAQFDSDPRLGLCYSALHFIDRNDRTVATLRSPLRRGDYIVDGLTELHHLAIQNCITVSNAVFRRATVEDVGHFREDLWFSAEWALWVRMALRWRVGYLDDTLASFRVHDTSSTQARTDDTEDFRNQLLTVVNDLFDRADLPPALRARHRLALANVELSTFLLRGYWGEWRGAARSLGMLARQVRPWEVADLLRSSSVVPRTVARLRASRRPS
jgi:glycosyltransferase involved in cell wall biosynthesis